MPKNSLQASIRIVYDGDGGSDVMMMMTWNVLLYCYYSLRKQLWDGNGKTNMNLSVRYTFTHSEQTRLFLLTFIWRLPAKNNIVLWRIQTLYCTLTDLMKTLNWTEKSSVYAICMENLKKVTMPMPTSSHFSSFFTKHWFDVQCYQEKKW